MVAVLLLLASCARTPDPGHLEIQFTGQWVGAPRIQATGALTQHLFMARLTGYVPPEAYKVVVFNPWGERMAESPLLWRDVMEVIPQRSYTFSWPVSTSTYWAVKDRLESRPETFSLTLDFPIRAVVLTQDGKTLAEKHLFVTIECLSCTV